jgi:hypothetical protein
MSFIYRVCGVVVHANVRGGVAPTPPVRKIFEKIFPTPFKNFYFFILVM